MGLQLLFAFALMGCTIGPASVTRAQKPGEFPHCDSVPETRLFPKQTLEGLEGRYRLVLVKTDGVRKPNKLITGLLWLWRASPRDSNAAGERPGRGDSLFTLYFGTTDIDLDAAEAYPYFRWPKPTNPTRDSVDAIHPPVIGIAHRGADEIGPWLWFALPIGTISNNRATGGGFDGVGAALTVERVNSRGFFGNWGRWGIVKTGTGYFCAYRDVSK